MTTDTTTSQRYWDDVQVGDELPGYELPLTWTRMAAQVSGSQDFYPVHHDPDFARAGGHRDIFYNTGFTRAPSAASSPTGSARKAGCASLASKCGA